ncbi:uncharacterized protein B0I36DRAFT_159510 [Microdochium trichocladiopsis]|uniref:Uncharacterized protein n=1 Tax=Microdochium trichocladiopsis TaxID=1682393 RepID=A0A9P9BMQ8_9PEZI|nr:uncharacterized protein B0I36DRAFT_159510 [Microdochium trichocladiopsis]KAH7026518.1 hypothetical protein B0I36DRAFT_159510 [Microdochium trichocladiopsis]
MPLQGMSNVFPGAHNYPSSDPSCSFFDWDRWEADQVEHGSSRSESNLSWSGLTDDQDAMSIDGGPRSDSRSIPDLVYGASGTPSDSGHPGSPSSPSADLGDYSYTAHLGHAKQHNDLFSIPPQPELDEQLLQYNSEVQVYGQLRSPLALTHEDYHNSPTKKSSKGSASKRPHGATEVPSKRTVQRGRRSGPLCNKDEVAEVRALGACFRCKITKVSCDRELDCEKCVKHAESRSGCYDSSVPLSQQICIRRSFAQCGRAFEKIQECQPSTAASKLARDSRSASQSMIWDVVFVPGGPILPISVVEHALAHDHADVYQTAPADYLLNRGQVPGLLELQGWVSSQMQFEGPISFQHSLDVLLQSLYGQKVPSGRKPEWKVLLDRVREMRCMFKIWSTNSFFCYRAGDSVPQELPWLVQAELKRIATSRMRSLELDILASLDKLLEPKEVKSLLDLQKITVWACLMECILLYRELLAMPSVNGSGFGQDLCMCQVPGIIWTLQG